MTNVVAGLATRHPLRRCRRRHLRPDADQRPGAGHRPAGPAAASRAAAAAELQPAVPFPGVNRGMIRPSQSTSVVIHGGLDNHPSALAPAFNATAGNAYGRELRPPQPGHVRQPAGSPVGRQHRRGQHRQRHRHDERPRSGRELRAGQLPHDRGDQPLRSGPADARGDGRSLRPHHRVRRHGPVQPAPARRTSIARGSTRSSST